MDLRLLRYFVAVAEEGSLGRAATRLHMSQPPLSRAIKQLEAEFGAVLLNRGAHGVTLTPTGTALRDEARTLLEQAEQARHRVTAAAGRATITIGFLADSAEQGGSRLAATFRVRHPRVDIRVRESDLSDPSAGLRAGVVDVALTRAPFDTTGMTTRLLRRDPVGVVLRSDDPLAGRQSVRLLDLAHRSWFRFPSSTDTLWRDYWRAGGSGDGPIVRTVHECLHAVLWNDNIGLTPLGHPLPDGLTAVPLSDFPPSRLIVAWPKESTSPLVQSFARVAIGAYRTREHRP